MYFIKITEITVYTSFYVKVLHIGVLLRVFEKIITGTSMMRNVLPTVTFTN